MTTTFSERQRLAFRDFKQRAAERAQRERDIEEGFKQRTAALEQEHQDELRRLDASFHQAQVLARQANEDSHGRLQVQFEVAHRQAEQDEQKAKQRAISHYVETKAKAEAEYKETRWTIGTLYEADKKVARDQVVQAQRLAKKHVDVLQQRWQEGQDLITKWDLAEELPLFLDTQAGEAPGDPTRMLQQAVDRAEGSVMHLRQFKAPALLKGLRPWFLIALGWALVSAPAVLFDEWYFWLIGSTAVAWPLGAALRWWLIRRTRRRVSFFWQALNQSVMDGKALRRRCLHQAKQAYRHQRKQSKQRNVEAMQEALKKARTKVKAARINRDELLRQARETYQPLLAQLQARRKQDLADLEDSFRDGLAAAERDREDAVGHEIERFKKARDDSNHRHASEWTRLVADWKQGCDQFRREWQHLAADCGRCFPAYHDNGQVWQPPADIPAGLLLGELTLHLEDIPGAIPEDPHLPRLDLNGADFPALLAFPEKASVVFLAQDQGKQVALEAIQGMLLRAWTALPPGKLKCTILDPVGRGENFAAFMHLADHDESLVNSRIWTEAVHIEQRLADLTLHMETVLQKYLRNQFETLAEYNVHAEEVAEPFRLIVAADFPVNYTPDACRRLISLASAGPRCGIYVFVVADTKQTLPQGIDLEDLNRACTVLTWTKDKFVWEDEDFSMFPLRLERLPAPETCTRLLSVVGEKAKLASRVEVPFHRITPPAEQWWKGSTRTGLQVPLGRSGATGKQLLTLGQGTSQHVLIAGKTGSGKSTLLHVLITQVALHYSPDEIELYLVDFKKGVEFKTYAAHELPHARVIAVESEREFGLSVLQRLDAELARRGELFRATGVNDLPSYRTLGGGKILPRMLLIVDEFQEFFTEDDKVAQEAALLLDRLVRQGRAFGIHVFLGSQTLGGAYSLARSTIDQMAVRIALQCSEADAHLILSKDNSDARLLSRPGEAIYNAANGLLEGNSLFQIVWLGDDQRDEYLKKVRALAAEREWRAAEPQIVFEGTAPADLTKNRRLQELLDKPAKDRRSAWTAWLGEAVAIKDPTAAIFRKQSGNNLLIVGQNEKAAFSLCAAAGMGLAPQVHGSRMADIGPFHFVSAVHLESEEETALARLRELLPLRLHPQRDLADLLAKLNEEIERRLQDAADPPLFLFLYGLQRLRDLRRPDDDFGFARRGEEKPSPFKQFINLLKEGPPVGLFTILWCDNLANLQRSLDRTAQREFELRVLFQMSAADSSTLIDNPIASKLGPNRALYYTEDQGRMEKFRPYGLPGVEWMGELKIR